MDNSSSFFSCLILIAVLAVKHIRDDLSNVLLILAIQAKGWFCTQRSLLKWLIQIPCLPKFNTVVEVESQNSMERSAVLLCSTQLRFKTNCADGLFLNEKTCSFCMCWALGAVGTWQFWKLDIMFLALVFVTDTTWWFWRGVFCLFLF